MLGAVSTELFLVPAFGILNSGLFALMFNLLAALIALRFSQAHETAPMRAPVVADVPRAVSTRSRRYIGVAFLSGALMLALEVVWFRFLLLTRDGTSLIFAVMLAVVLGAGFILLPMVGVELSFFLIATTYLLVALLVPRDNQASRLPNCGVVARLQRHSRACFCSRSG